MLYELNHVGGPVRDLDAALEFWSSLGARVVWRGVIPATSTDIVYVAIGGALIEMLCTPGAAAGGLDHIAFLSDDLDADFERLVASGSAILVEPRTAGSGVGRLAFVADPDGRRVELLQRDLVMDRRPDGASGRVDYVLGGDADRAIPFYRDRIGLDPNGVDRWACSDQAVRFDRAATPFGPLRFTVAAGEVLPLGAASYAANGLMTSPDGDRVRVIRSD